MLRVVTRIAVCSVLSSIGSTLFGLGTAEAQTSPCLAPWGLFDKWDEHNPVIQPWSPVDTYDRYDANGSLLSPADVYIAPGLVGSTGFKNPNDLGLRLVVNDHLFVPVDVDPVLSYGEILTGCTGRIVSFGDVLSLEPGSLRGRHRRATTIGAAELLARDPDAEVGAQFTVVSEFPVSPREVYVLLVDTDLFAIGQGKPKSIRVVNLLRVFIEGILSNGDVSVVLVAER